MFFTSHLSRVECRCFVVGYRRWRCSLSHKTHNQTKPKLNPTSKANQTKMGIFHKKANKAPIANVSGRTKVAIDGYDPVSFFDENEEPVNGNFQISSVYEGATYFFKDEANKKRFEANPAKFVPQYGGYCAFGVSVGAMLPVDIKTAQVYKDRLYINLNGDVLKSFNEDLDEIIAKADAKWPTLVAKSN